MDQLQSLLDITHPAMWLVHITMYLPKRYIVHPYWEELESFMELRSCLMTQIMIKMQWRNILHAILSLVHKTHFSPCIKYHFHNEIRNWHYEKPVVHFCWFLVQRIILCHVQICWGLDWMAGRGKSSVCKYGARCKHVLAGMAST